MASDTHAGNLNAHAGGVAAILQVDIPLDLFVAVRLIQSRHPLVSNGIVQVRILYHPYSLTPDLRGNSDSLRNVACSLPFTQSTHLKA